MKKSSSGLTGYQFRQQVPPLCALPKVRDCFTLVRPLSDEKELQRLDRISMDKLRPEFKSGLDALTRFVFERTRPKQVGATVMTGPIFAGITQSFLDALNNDAVPTITSSWQSVEETKCKRAVEYATEVYKSSFDSSKPVLSPLKKRQYEKHMKKLFRRLWLPLIQLLLELVLLGRDVNSVFILS
ncbi:putative guanylate-binding protein/Atlastin [Helianthus annuus]|nr:putative guanylate-binding protein/Atlastin [Helianthus annuus]